MVDTVVGILKVSFEIYTEIKGMNDDIIANRKSVSLLISRFDGVAEEVNAIVESGDASDRKMEPARNYCTLCADARDFLCQFTKHDRVTGLARKTFAWASKAYNRKADQAALEDFLKRLDTCSRDLNLRVTLDIKQSTQQLKEDTASIITLLQEDGGEMRDMLQEFHHAVLQSQDEHARVQEAQFHLLQSAISELDIRLTSSSEGSTCGSTDSKAVPKRERAGAPCYPPSSSSTSMWTSITRTIPCPTTTMHHLVKGHLAKCFSSKAGSRTSYSQSNCSN
jgi:hypothetical protein